MNWKSLFTFTALARGEFEYQQGHVAAFSKAGQLYQAWIEGNEDYQVSIDLTDPEKPDMNCSCGYATENRPCLHMAALFYRIDEEELLSGKQKGRIAPISEGSPEKERKDPQAQTAGKIHRVFPFGQDPTLMWEIGAREQKSYRYFDLATITRDYDFFSDAYAKARRGIERGLALLENMTVGYEPALDLRNLVCTVMVKIISKGNQWPVTMAFNKDRLLKMECQVPGCDCNKSHMYLRRINDYSHPQTLGRGGDREKLCAHMIAALLLAEEKLAETNPGDSTDRTAQRMLQAYRKRRAAIFSEAETTVLAEQISMEPRLALEKDGLKVSFRAGTDKMYVLKSLPQFVEAAENHRSLEVGTKASINMALHDFSQRGREYYDFVSEIIKGEKSRTRFADTQVGRNADLGEYIRDSIPLYGKRLDDFFDLAMGRSLDFTDRRGGAGHYTIRLQERDPKPPLVIRAMYERGIFAGITVEGEMKELFEGEERAYFFEGKYLCRVSEEGRQKLAPLMQLTDYGNRIRFTVGLLHLPEFYYRILPVLRDCACVEEPDADQIAANLPPEAEFIFYMDVEEGRICCKPVASYLEEEYALSDWETGVIPNREKRDNQLEKETLQVVTHYFTEREGHTYYCKEDPDTAYELLENGLPKLMEYGEIRASDRFRRLKIHKNARFSLGISLESDLLNLEVVSDQYDREELLLILQSYREKKKFYRLRNGDFLSLEQDNLAELSAMLDALHVTPKEFVEGKMKLPLYRALYLNRMLEENEDIYARRDSTYKRLVKEFKTVRDSDFEVPAHLQQIMRNYQLYGYKWLRTLQQGHFGGILADDMGLGKTLQMIAVIAADKEALQIEKQEAEGKAQRAEAEPEETDGRHISLIVCPASLVYNWKEEFSRFAPELAVLPVTGTQPVRKDKIASWRDYDVLITSYDLLKRDAAEYEGITFTYQVIDEAQYIKNHNTEAAKAVKIIRAAQRYALTGTPIENRLSELWSIFDYLMPGLLYDYQTFRRDFEIPIVKGGDKAVTSQLQRMVAPFILRRLKRDVLKDLPEKLEEVRYANMETAQREIYDAQVVHMQQLLSGMDEAAYQQNRIAVLAEITKIRKLCCDPALQVEDYTGGSAKREACMDLIRSAIEGEHKVLLFSQFVTMLELLERDLQEAGIPYYKITGAVPKEKRLELVKAFNSDATPVFLISLKAGGTGLNLTGADIVIHYDPWWNLAAQNQATDRAHRIGQTKVVSVYRLIAKDTIEEKILKMQEDKQNLADEILSGENGSLSSLSRGELEALFL